MERSVPENKEGQWRHHAHGHCPAHEKAGSAKIVQMPKQEGFNETPEGAGKHHHAQEGDHFSIFCHLANIAQNPFAYFKQEEKTYIEF